MDILQVITNSFPLFFTIGVVIFLRYKKVLKKEDAKSISPLLFKLVLPFFVFTLLYEINIDSTDLNVSIFLIIIHFLLLLSIIGVGKVFNIKKQLTGTLLLLALAYSVGPVVYPFVQMNFDENIFGKVVLLDMSMFLMIMILAPIVAAVFNHDDKFNLRKIGKSLITDPILISLVLAVIVRVLGINVPEPFIKSFEYIGSSFSFLVAVFVALTLTLPSLQRVKLLLGLTLFRFISAIGIGFLIIVIVAPSEEMKIALLMTLFTSFSSFPLVYTDKYKLDSDLVAQASIFSRIFAFILIPILIAVIKS